MLGLARRPAARWPGPGAILHPRCPVLKSICLACVAMFAVGLRGAERATADGGHHRHGGAGRHLDRVHDELRRRPVQPERLRPAADDGRLQGGGSAGRPSPTARRRRRGSIPANGTKSVTLPRDADLRQPARGRAGRGQQRRERPLHAGRRAVVRVPGACSGDLRVPVQSSGTLALKQILGNPRAVMESPAARKLAQDLVGSFLRSLRPIASAPEPTDSSPETNRPGSAPERGDRIAHP